MSDKILIGTVGLGLMGCSIAACILSNGYTVISVEKEDAKIKKSRDKILEFLQQLWEEKLMSEEPDEALKRFTITNDFSKLSNCKIVIESITESVTDKISVYHQLEKVIAPDAIIGSNTSAIPVSILQAELQHPERLIGIHWAEPAHITRFMEVICGDKSDISFAEKIISIAKDWNKEPSLLKKDIRGFITNRIFYAMLREAFYLVENGYATIEDVDRSVRNDYGYWMTFAGPFRFMDLTGIPAYLTVMQDLFPELSNGTTPPASIKTLVSEGAKGVSNAKGFYNYTKESATEWEEQFLKFSYDIRKLANIYLEKS
jgi:3-hydroxybutyryl-CoA dehydrogenase